MPNHASPELAGTKLALILAAGELFAEHGVDGTSVRTIAEKAGANIAAVNYHFGSKENLYTETLRYVALEGSGTRPSAFVEDDERLSTPERIAATLTQAVKAQFDAYYNPEMPPWYARLMIRALLDPSPSFEQMLRQIMVPDHLAFKRIFQKARPGASDMEAQLWAFSVKAQIVFYVFCRAPVLMLLGRAEYDKFFLEAAAEHTVRSTIAALGLPQVEA